MSTSNFINEDSGTLGSLGRALAHIRQDRCLSIEELAEQAGCSAREIKELENGGNGLNLELIYRLVRAMDTGFGTLFKIAAARRPEPQREARTSGAFSPDRRMYPR